MKWRSIADFIIHLLAAVTVVLVVMVSAANLMASSVHDREIRKLNKEIAEMRINQKNFDNNVIDWLMQLGETVRKNNLMKVIPTEIGSQGGSK
ncbi:MAG: hypothetical protein HY226_02990 [Candidatus Vogelbacteria bacterium]|nr:hypothetical protein [Candidatus Vogelbacteria bacterium]